jgi:hypothetical protein
MKKKIFSVAALSLFTAASLFAGDFGFVFGGIGQHPDKLGGILPTYYNVGVGYKGLTLLENNTTEFQFLVGGGFSQRTLFQDVNTGAPVSGETKVDISSIDGTFKIKQGYLNDDLTADLSLKAAYQYISDSDVVVSDIYPDLGDNKATFTSINYSLLYDKMDDRMFTQDGYSAEFELTYAPSFTNTTADFISGNLELQFAKTLYTLQSPRNNRNILSLVLVDRFSTSYTEGDVIPTSFESKVALGNRVRGFSTYSYNTKMNFVNNLDLRVGTFEITETSPIILLPRFNFFFDTGYAMGEYLNSSVSIDSSDALLMSTGLQATISVADQVDLGYQFAYLLSGENYQEGSDAKLINSFTFFLFF